MRHTSTPPRQRIIRGTWENDRHVGSGCGMDTSDHIFCPTCQRHVCIGDTCECGRVSA